VAHILVICAKRYNGHELWTALGVLQERGHTFEVVSQSLIIRDEKTLRPNTIERTIEHIPLNTTTLIKQFQGMMIVSGNMEDTEAYWVDKRVEFILQTLNAKKYPIAAICCSVPTLAPIAKGKRVSFYPLVRSRQRLEQFGAILSPVTISIDKNLVTAEHQMASEMWVNEYCNLLDGKPPQYTFTPTGFTPGRRPRKIPLDIQRVIDREQKLAANKRKLRF